MPEPHELLDRAMSARSTELRKRWVQIAQEAEITTSALGAIRRGEYRPSVHTARGLERAFEWEHGSIDAIYEGREPTPIEPNPPSGATETPTVAELADRVALLERLVTERMTPEERKRFGIGGEGRQRGIG